MKILYEDSEIIVCHKPAGVAVQSRHPGVMDLESMVKNHLAGSCEAGKQTAGSRIPGYQSAGKHSGRIPYLGIINRLDQPVEGIVLMAKTKESAAVLTSELQEGKIVKEYLAVTEAEPPGPEGYLTDYLKKDARQNCSVVVPEGTAGAKKAMLYYRSSRVISDAGLKESSGTSDRTECFIRPACGTLLYIRLYTGRHHQIRVQMANAGMPLVGDYKYNPGGRKDFSLALCAFRLTFEHPAGRKKMEAAIYPDNEIFVKPC